MSCAVKGECRDTCEPLRLNIGNVWEFYEPYLAPLDEAARRRWRSSALAVGGAALLWDLAESPVASRAGPARLAVLPTGIQMGLVHELDERLGLGGVEVLVPRADSGLLSCDLAGDNGALERLVELARLRGGEVQLNAWGETRGLCALLKELKLRGLRIRGPYGGRGNLERVARLDSKAGLRALARLKGGELEWLSSLMPEGEVCMGGLEEAAAIAQRMALSGPVVVKAALATSGVGQVRIERGSYTVREVGRRLEFAARGAPELVAWPLVVERYHPPKSSCAVGQAAGYSVQLSADGKGGARLLFAATQINVEGLSCSVLGASEVEFARYGELETLGEELGGQLSAWGYRGVFGADFVATEGGELKLLEINARRTTLSAGGELLKLVANRGAGAGEGACVICVDRFSAGAGPMRLEEQKSKLSGLLFPIGGSPQGWVPLPIAAPSVCAEGAGVTGGASPAGFVVAQSPGRAVELVKMVRAAHC